MTALEKIGPTPERLGGTALYDWDHLVEEDRVHRLIYTDPAIFEAEMTHIFVSNAPGDIAPGTSGRPVAGHDVALVDDTGQPAPVHQGAAIRLLPKP